MRTPGQIQAEIEALQEVKPKVREFTYFGDSNHEAIELQIAVLKGEVSEDGLYDEYGGDNTHLLDAGREAIDWLEGIAETLAEEWLDLI